MSKRHLFAVSPGLAIAAFLPVGWAVGTKVAATLQTRGVTIRRVV
jgi:hypothetical protein